MSARFWLVLFLTRKGHGGTRRGLDLIQKLVAVRLFRRVSIGQVIVHLLAYIACFIQLIMIEAGGYYDTKILLFMAMTAISMPLFGISGWLIQHSWKISQSQRFWGYCVHLGIFVWSISIVKVSYGI